MIKELFKIAADQNVDFITGWISTIDWNHIDRLKHFYEKNGFKIEIDSVEKKGTIQWRRI